MPLNSPPKCYTFVLLPIRRINRDPPVQIVPRGMIYSVVTLFGSSVFVLFVCSSLPPGLYELSTTTFPLSYGFSTFSAGTKEADM